MKKIGLIADTHDSMEAIKEAVQYFNSQKVDLVVHAGDFCSGFTARAFRDLRCPLAGVFGENDGDERELREAYGKMKANIHKELLELQLTDNLKLAAIHGTSESIVKALVKSKEYDFIVTGHIHKVIQNKVDGVLTVNPGEACGFLTGKRTIGILRLIEKECDIVQL